MTKENQIMINGGAWHIRATAPLYNVRHTVSGRTHTDKYLYKSGKWYYYGV